MLSESEIEYPICPKCKKPMDVFQNPSAHADYEDWVSSAICTTEECGYEVYHWNVDDSDSVEWKSRNNEWDALRWICVQIPNLNKKL